MTLAIKVLLAESSADRMARLEQEARVAGSLNHPHIQKHLATWRLRLMRHNGN